MSPSSGIDQSGLTFLFIDEADALDALVGRIVPGSPEDPGAREAGVVTYIDRALVGPYAQWQGAYREGLRLVNAHAMRRYSAKFRELSEEDQDAIVGALEVNQIDGFGGDAAAGFFAMVWAHTIEGLFGDPAYGGNRNAVGWRLIGFPGAQYGYGAEEMRYGADLTTKPIMTLADMRKLAQEQPNLFYRRSQQQPVSSPQEVPEMPSRESTVDTAKNQGG